MDDFGFAGGGYEAAGDQSEDPLDQWEAALAGPMALPWLAPPMMPRFGWAGPSLPMPPYAGAAAGGAGMPQHKARFCATFPEVGRCRHGPNCAFAHSRAEVNAPLLSVEEEQGTPGALTQEFFIERFKTLWCPIGAQHDWQACMYAHTYQDVRRPPAIGYGHQLCPYWNKKDTSLAYSQRCPLGHRCPYAHGAKEQLYHPGYFRVLVCRDLQRRRCPRGLLCAFFHRQADCRVVGQDKVDYSRPLSKQALPAEWVAYFMSPPRFQEAATEGTDLMGFAAAPAAAMSFPPALPTQARRGGRHVAAGSRAFAVPPPKRELGEATPRTETTAEESNAEAEDAEDTASSQDALVPQFAAGQHVMASQLQDVAADDWCSSVPGGDGAAWGMMPYCMGGGYQDFAGMYPTGLAPGFMCWDPALMYSQAAMFHGHPLAARGGGKGGRRPRRAG